jgi:hypothetical protein
MVKRLGSIAAAFLLTACGSSIALPLSTPSPSPVGADTPAADLRTRTDLLFGEHTYVIAKLAVAAAAGRKDEFHSYAGALVANGADITTLMRLAIGETAGSQFGETWMLGNNYFVDYVVAAATHDSAKQSAATSGLTATYLPQMTGLLTSSLSLTTEQAAMIGSDQVSGVKQIVDDAVTSGFAALYGDLRAVYIKAIRAGDLISEAIVSRLADRFPGNAQAKSANFRGVLDTLLLYQGYLITMSTNATVAGTAREQNAVTGALTLNTSLLTAVFGGVFGTAAGAQFGHVWDSEATLLIAYAKGGDAAVRQTAIATAASPNGPAGSIFGPDMTEAVTASLQAIDDQRARSFDKLADDDHSAAMLLAGVGDGITAVAVRQMPAKFV